MNKILPLLLSAGLFAAGSALAVDAFGPPAFIDYQGRVLASDGNPLAAEAPTNYEMEFRLYDEPVGGIVVWAEKQLVTVNNGQFSVRLGEGQPILIPAGGGSTEGTVDHLSPGLPGAFNGASRHLGVTVKIVGQTPSEITPRLAFLSSPFSFVAATAGKLMQANGTTSDLKVGSIAYATTALSGSALLSISNRTTLVNASASLVTATLPESGAFKEILVAKTDSSANQVLVAPPAGGTLNGAAAPVYLKVRGECVTLQNVGGNDWWIVSERRDTTPPGTILAFGGNGAIPAGYLDCNGGELSRSQYPDLFAAIGTVWGTANGSVFNLPITGGRFLRGVDAIQNREDEEAHLRVATSLGGATGRNVGTFQPEAFRSHGHGVADPGHSHSINRTANVEIGTRGVANGSDYRMYSSTINDVFSTANINQPAYNASSATTGISIQAAGGAETRPDNVGVRYIIKY